MEKDILKVDFNYYPYVNFSFIRNNIALYKDIQIENKSDDVLNNLKCTLESTQGIFPTISIPLSLDAKAKTTIESFDFPLVIEHSYFKNLTETVESSIVLKIFSETTGEILFEESFTLTSLSFDTWLGPAYYPELLVSFVTPHMPIVEHLAGLIRTELKKTLGDGSTKGYGADKKHVYEVCKATYNVLHNQGINYSYPPSSLGDVGQRIRFADNIILHKAGTCLDLTILFASVLENLNLNPLIFLYKEHAFVGCFLEDLYFQEMPECDLQKVRKRSTEDLLTVFETTSITSDKAFEEAEVISKSWLYNEDEFEMVIDVKRARLAKVRPFAITRTNDEIQIDEIETVVNELPQIPTRRLTEQIDLRELEEAEKETEKNRIDNWKSKLLDLSLNNRLLNMKYGSSMIPLLMVDITKFEDCLADKEELQLRDAGGYISAKELYDMSMMRNFTVTEALAFQLQAELTQNRIWAALNEKDFLNRALKIFRQSKTDIEEGGVNTLYVSIGSLEWCDKSKNLPHYAPILLVPVQLSRKNISSGYRLKRIDEDTIINVTLLQLLEREFNVKVPGLNPLPTDDHGVDVEKVLQIFRQSVMHLPHFEVREEANLGLFSFSKITMWNDLETNGAIFQQQNLVAHLMKKNGEFDDGIKCFPPHEIEKHLNFNKLYCPLSADSSQLTAVLYSELGKSFVLHGPPGTGKSQTITNIIAHNLALGKRILFVSEKKAALDVVHSRLSKIGLKPYCLELHSNKSQKKEVLRQFEDSLRILKESDLTAENLDEDWNDLTQKLSTSKEKLNNYVRALHYKYPNGFSVYEAAQGLIANDFSNEPARIFKEILTHEKSFFEEFLKEIDAYILSYEGVASWDYQKYLFIKPLEWTPALETELLQLPSTLLADMQTTKNNFAHFAATLQIATNFELDDLEKILELYEILKSITIVDESLFSIENFKKLEHINNELELSLDILKQEEEFSSYNIGQFSSIDETAVQNRINSNNQKFFIAKFFANKTLLRELKDLKKIGNETLTLNELENLIPKITKYKALKNQEQTLGCSYTVRGKDFILKLQQQVLEMKPLKEFLNANYSAQKDVIWTAINNEFLDSFEFKNFETSSSVYRNALNLYTKYFECNNQTTLDSCIENIENLKIFRGNVRNLLLYIQARNALNLRGCAYIVNKCENNEVQDLKKYAELLYKKEFFDNAISENASLSQFLTANHNLEIENFKAIDCAYREFAKNIAAQKIAQKIKTPLSNIEREELGVLHYECQKQKRHKPIRLLLDRIPNLAKRLKPCFLMSPLSCAQYLKSELNLFDLVIFDEASQIPTWDAIGVIARATQVIVVGDPKQMPPTNFFQKNFEALQVNEGEEVFEDLESVLDESLAAGMESSHLNWHYRSRHESLIAFSNHYYYDDNLFTFPAAKNSLELGVHFKYIENGSFINRKNNEEAKAIVEYIFARLKNKNLAEKSIGVVTFNTEQRECILDLIDEYRRRNPLLESYFDDQRSEPFFVKNLENVQGDERDIILFSVGYAKDAGGKLKMNFGPLSNDGGERRLNVAVTRAKEMIIVFSSILSSHIDTNRARARGAHHLSKFLNYAEKGLHITKPNDTEIVQNGAIEKIKKILQENGFAFKEKIGDSNYKIDLGVYSKKYPQQFLLGIESDNPIYASQKTTRDRDSLRKEVLESLNWNIHKAWTFSWIYEQERATKELLEKLEKLESEITPDEVVKIQTENSTEDNNFPVYKIYKPTQEFTAKDFENKNILKEEILKIIECEAPIKRDVLEKRLKQIFHIDRLSAKTKEFIQNAIPTSKIKTYENPLYADSYWVKSPKDYQIFRVPEKDATEKRAIDEIPKIEILNAKRYWRKNHEDIDDDFLIRDIVALFGFSKLTTKMRDYLS